MFLLGIAAEVRAGVMYGITGGQNSNSTLYTIDLGTAAITFLDPPSLKTSRTGLAFDSGDDLYLKDWNQLFAIDPLTAQLASVRSVAGASNLHNVLGFGESGTLSRYPDRVRNSSSTHWTRQTLRQHQSAI